MRQIILNEKLTLSFETLDKGVRLIISEADMELVCRKETYKNLQNFLKADEINIFKGRLQLHKRNEIIEVVIKNKPSAIISTNDFKNVLDNL
ncbi:hypothetical protein FA048_09005 [Pedobacter polaris]|uniref:Uncharacterized protein n=1 Tax=Pedobacter polaris TaxID=2571273 RepID=A0A4U1CQN1_9SPHI|nr:hypothetical protein [Pedobacter polaris]TKC10321.1 hypothetical protein FA048_09005 [Pedobacter polaris]